MTRSHAAAIRCFGIMLCLAGLFPLMTGCARFGRFAKERADREAYEIIESKHEQAGLTQNLPLGIDPGLNGRTQEVLENAHRLNLGQDTYTTPSYQLSLGDTLAIAFSSNRDYQARKERMFSRALTLSRVRYDFGWHDTASATGNLTRTVSGYGTGGPRMLEVFGDYGFGVGLSKLFATGARVSASYTHNFLQYLINERTSSGSNSLAFTVVQPLLRGMGPLVVHEPLRQAERDMIYEVRDFLRYQQNFVITVSDRFYGLLSSRDQLRNARTNLKQTLYNWDYVGSFEEAGRRSGLDVDQSRQNVLQAETRLSDAEANYLGQLDRFKDFLGLPVDLDIGPDPDELELIADRGLLRPDLGLEEAINIALEDRLDLKTVSDRVADSQRSVRIALRDFLPNLDFSYTFTSTRADPGDEFSLETRNNTQRLGLDLDLPLDWTPRRNSYRGALIDLQQARRSLEAETVGVILEVREAWRQLERQRRNHAIQVESVRLAERRVDSTELLFKAGEATIRDVLEAQEDLVSAQDAVTDALVSHTIQRLRFWDAIERLKIDPQGMWYE